MKRLAVPLWLKVSRSPLRADDENSKQIPPFTGAASQATGPHTVAAFCEARDFHRDAVILLDGWPDNMPIPYMLSTSAIRNVEVERSRS
jgi:hypothetical protein